MSELSPSALELRDALLDFQALHQMSGAELEPAVIDGMAYEDCAVFVDQRTSRRLVLSDMRRSDQEFEGVNLVISEELGSMNQKIDDVTLQTPELVIAVDSELRPAYLEPESGNYRPMTRKALMDVIGFPKFKPKAVSESDPRDIPPLTPKELRMALLYDTDVDQLSVPQTDIYTNISGLFDKALLSGNLRGQFVGTTPNQENALPFFLQISEMLPDAFHQRLSDFDRHYSATISTLNTVDLTATPLGEHETTINGNQFSFRVMRDGIIMYAARRGKRVHCVPSKQTLDFVNQAIDDIWRVS